MLSHKLLVWNQHPFYRKLVRYSRGGFLRSLLTSQTMAFEKSAEKSVREVDISVITGSKTSKQSFRKAVGIRSRDKSRRASAVILPLLSQWRIGVQFVTGNGKVNNLKTDSLQSVFRNTFQKLEVKTSFCEVQDLIMRNMLNCLD